jgi:L-fuculose-phosphate aldolase
MTQDFLAERTEVLDAVRRIADSGLVAGSSGNVSRRIRADGGDLFAVTASSVPYHRFGIDDVVVVDGDVDPVFGDGVPSSESLAHMAVYAARADVGAVIHTHSVYASAFAVAGMSIPCVIDEQVIVLGGEVEVAQYGASASDLLAANAVAALGDRAAVLLRHHGALGVGRDLEEAVAVVELVERVAKIRLLSMQLGGGQQLTHHMVEAQQRVYRMLKGFKEN